MGNGADMGNAVLVGCHDRCHNENVQNLANFRRLDMDVDHRKRDPALITGVVIRAEGDQ